MKTLEKMVILLKSFGTVLLLELCLDLLGVQNISDYVPRDCMIHRENFQSDSELVDYLQKMT